jgi:hypothetical protein
MAVAEQVRSPLVDEKAPFEQCEVAALADRMQVGDLVFIRIPHPPFRQVALHTGSWSNHVGIVVQAGSEGVRIAESRIPVTSVTSFERFVRRSDEGRIAISRFHRDLSIAQKMAVERAAAQRMGILYDTGFNLESRRQFCSRYVREVLCDATGEGVGTVQSFADLLAERPGVSLAFWRLWYFGRIPWQRRTVTPASVLESPLLRTVFDGCAR